MTTLARARTATALSAVLALLAVSQPNHGAAPPGTGIANARLASVLWNSTVAFVPNAGQMHPGVRFAAELPQGTLLVTANEVFLVLAHARGEDSAGTAPAALDPFPPPPLGSESWLGRASAPAVVRLRFAGGDQLGGPVGEAPLDRKVNFFLSPDPARWRTNLPAYARLRWRSARPGFEVVLEGLAGGTVQARLEGGTVPGARRPELDLDGATVTTGGQLLAHGMAIGKARLAPAHYEPTPRTSQPVDPATVAAAMAQADVLFSLCLGGLANDGAYGVAADDQGNVYVTGHTGSYDFPVVDSVQPTKVGDTAAFVTKIRAADQSIAYSTYLGGYASNSGTAIAVDAAGHAYVVGTTSGGGFPTTPGAYRDHAYPQTCQTQAPCLDLFVAQLDSSGSRLIYSTYLGGSEDDFATGIAVGGDASALVAGTTRSPDFATRAALQSALRGVEDAFVARLNPDGTDLVFSTYLGGSGLDLSNDVALDRAGNVIIAGETASPDFPTSHPLQAGLAGDWDGFVTSLAADGSALVYSTYLGGSGPDFALAVVSDSTGGVAVVGGTASMDFLLGHGVMGPPKGGRDGFVVQLAPAGDAIESVARIGGAGDDEFRGLALDAAGRMLLAGVTDSDDLPVQRAWQPQRGGGKDAFVAVLAPGAAVPLVLSYLGGSQDERIGIYHDFPGIYPAHPIAVDPQGNPIVVGWTQSSDFPITGSLNPAGGCQVGAPYTYSGDAFIVAVRTPLGVGALASPSSGAAPLNVTFSARTAGGTPPFSFVWTFGDGVPGGSDATASHTYLTPGTYTATVTVTDGSGSRAVAFVNVDALLGCTPGCSALAPLVAASGSSVAFTSEVAVASDCGEPPAVSWSFGDGAASAEPNPHHTYAVAGVYSWSFRATAGSQSCAKSGAITITAGQPSYVQVVPAVAHLPGVGGSQWRTDLAATNAAGTGVDLTLAYLSEAAPRVRTVSIPAGASLHWTDVLEELFGFAASSQTSGSFLLASPEPVAIASRTYNLTTGGTYGQSYPALAPFDGLGAGAVGVIPGLRKNSSFRTNVGAVNLGGTEAVVRITLFDGNGSPIGTPLSLTLPGGRWGQINDPLGKVGVVQMDLASAKVEVLTLGARVWAYASLIDNRTGDPTTVPVVVP